MSGAREAASASEGFLVQSTTTEASVRSITAP